MFGPAPLHSEAHGMGSAIVLGHGFGGSARNFRPQVRALKDRCRIVLFDARGHARSPGEDRPEFYNEVAQIADWKQVLDTNHVARAVVGGLSMGAAGASRFALAYPERVTALVLASFPRGDDSSRIWAQQFASALERESVGDALRSVATLPGSPVAGASVGLVGRGMSEHSVHALRHTLRALLQAQQDVRPLASALCRFDWPILLVTGELDARAVESASIFGEVCPRAEVVSIPHAGHVVNLEAQAEFGRHLISFLERHNLLSPKGS